METQDILSAAEAAATLGVSAGRVYALIKGRRLPARKISRAWVIARADLARVTERRPGRPRRSAGRESSQGHASTDPTRGEEVPRPSEELFQGVFDQMAVGLALTALDGRLVAVNQALCRMLGYTAQELLALRYVRLTHPDDLAESRATIRRLLADEIRTATLEKRYMRKDGQVVWSQYTTTLLRDAADQPLHLIIQIYDITDRRRVEEALRTSEERLRLVVANLPVILFALDADGVFTLSEGRGLERLGLVPGAAVGHSAFDLYATNALIVDQTRRALAGVAVSYVSRVAGVAFDMRVVPLPEGADGRRGVIGAAVDVTARLEAEEALRQNEQQLRTLIEHAPVGACIVDEHDTFVTVNAAYCALFGYTREELVGHPTALVTARTAHPEQATRLIAEGVRQGHAQGEVEVVTKGGQPVTVLATSIPLIGPAGRPQRAAFVIDITDWKQREQDLDRQAHTDALTGLPNRALFLVALEQAVAHAQRYGRLLALLFIDLDGFKQVNDTRGHHVGDLVLRAVAQQLRACLRQSDTAARLAGDEFTVLLPEVRSPAAAARVAQKILAAFAEGVRVGDAALPVGASIGISLYPQAGQDGHSLLTSTDAAMYVAKAQGKNRYAVAGDAAPGPGGRGR